MIISGRLRTQYADRGVYNNKMQSVLMLAGSIFLPLVGGGIGGITTAKAIPNWYAGLRKPSWNPPSWLFGPVWTALYISMGVSAWLVWQKVGFTSPTTWLWVYLAQLGFNFTWSYLFFGIKRIDLAMIDIIAMWISIAATIATFWTISPLAAALLIPYLAWVSFASFLNFTILKLNPIPSPDQSVS